MLQIYTTPFVMEQLGEHYAQGSDSNEGSADEASADDHRPDDRVDDADTVDVDDAVLRLLVHLALSRDQSRRARVCADENILKLVSRAAAQDSAGAAAVRNVFASIAAGSAALNATAVSGWPAQRHSNDVADFRSIEVVPIAAEMLKDAHVYLPMADGSDQFLQWHAVERGVDRAFRLFREDQISDVRSALHNAYAAKPTAPRPCVFKNAAVIGVDVDAPVPCVVLEFDVPERVRKLRTLADKVRLPIIYSDASELARSLRRRWGLFLLVCACVIVLNNQRCVAHCRRPRV